MKRWNGWGDAQVELHLAPGAQSMLAELVGSKQATYSVNQEELLAKVPTSSLPEHPLLDHSPATRLQHARGQSFPDWVDLRGGLVNSFPEAVAFPETDTDVRQLLVEAKSWGVKVIPYGGGTSVVGHLTPRSGQPTLSLSLERMKGLRHYDETNRLATFGAGTAGPDLEAALRAHNRTLGHFPQSFEFSTVGGWVVTRSAGQQSLGYGRIEDLFAGGRLIAPSGQLDMPCFPASAAGPDLRQIIMGSEGRMGVLTEAVVRVSSLPEWERFHAVFFPDWEAAEKAVRSLVQNEVPLSMLRLSNAIETQTNLTLAGKEKLVHHLKKLLSFRKVGSEGCMLLLGFTGLRSIGREARAEALSLCRAQGGVHTFRALGNAWFKNRFRTPYLRNTLWEEGYAVDTLETCTNWTKVRPTMAAIEAALHSAMEKFNERIHVFTHLSHFYSSGASIYTTYVFRLAPTPEETLDRWRALKAAASQALVANGATITHQHGVGLDHAPYLPAEKGPLGISLLSENLHHLDPDGLMNPGKLL